MKRREVDCNRLCMAMNRARLSLKRYRENATELIRQYAGPYWSEETAGKKQPVNLLALYVSVVGRNLLAKNPRVMLSTFNRSLKPTVSAMQSWANEQIPRIRLAETLQRVVVDSLFSVGICKVALAGPAESAAVAWHLQAGHPFAQSIDLDDFVFDVHARNFEEVRYIGHRYRVPLDVVKDSKIYGKFRKKLEASHDDPFNIEGDLRTNVLGRGMYTVNEEEFEDMVDLWEVYLPGHRQVLTLANDQMVGASEGGTEEPLRVQRWIGPDSGPYHILSMGNVPGNAMPKAPLQDLLDLHECANSSYRKMMRTIERLKEVFLFSNPEDAERAQKTDDGGMCAADRPDSVKSVVYSGAAMQTATAMAVEAIDRFGYFAGNLNMMGGLSPQAKTLGQDKMLAENASRAVADMQDRTVTYTGQVAEALCWYWWHDPFLVMRYEHQLQSGVASLTRQVHPARSQDPNQLRRVGSFAELGVRVDPYSIQQQTPQSRLQFLNQVMQQAMPMMALLQQQGIMLDMNFWMKKMAEYGDSPDLSGLFTIQEPPAAGQQGGGGGEQPGMQPETTRNYVRESMPSQTRESSDRNTIQTMLGMNPGGNPNTSRNGALATK